MCRRARAGRWWRDKGRMIETCREGIRIRYKNIKKFMIKRRMQLGRGQGKRNKKKEAGEGKAIRII